MTDATPSFDFSDFLVREAEFRARAAAVRPANKAALFAALTAAGVTHVTVAFDGCGDSGQIEDIMAKAGDADCVLPSTPVDLQRVTFRSDEVETRTETVREVIEAMVYDFLEETHGGWENNEGAFGDVIFDVAADTVTLEYNERIESTEYHEHAY